MARLDREVPTAYLPTAIALHESSRFCLDENLHAISARDARLPRKCSQRETEFFNRIDPKRP
jgi:NADH pyrophosphatase NudC (nudix superfamily)